MLRRAVALEEACDMHDPADRPRRPRRLPVALVPVLLVAACAGEEAGAGTSAIVAANYGGTSGETIQRTIADPYAAEAGIQIQHVNVGSGFAAKIQAQHQAGNVGWDVVEGLGSQEAAVLWSEGMLEPLPPDLRQRLEAVSVPGAVNEYGVALGNTGIVIACNTAVVQRCPANPAEFWDTASFPGRRAMMDNPFQTLATAAVAAGVATDQVFPIDLDRAFGALEQIKPAIDVWTTSGDQQMQVMRDGQAEISVMWNGRAKSLIDSGVPLQLSWDGSLVNPNYMVVIKGGPNTAGAMRYVEWYGTHPEAQAGVAKELAYGVSHEDTLGLLSPDEAALLPAAHTASQVQLDAGWWVENADQVAPRWKEFLAG
jgi:putative spermidine/putrescine transport system substrate-binding protein